MKSNMLWMYFRKLVFQGLVNLKEKYGYFSEHTFHDHKHEEKEQLELYDFSNTIGRHLDGVI